MSYRQTARGLTGPRSPHQWQIVQWPQRNVQSSAWRIRGAGFRATQPKNPGPQTSRLMREFARTGINAKPLLNECSAAIT